MFEPSRRTLLAGMAAAAAACPAIADRASTIDAAALQGDVALLRKTFAVLHPGLHRYNTPSRIDAHFQALSDAVSRPRTLAGAQLAFAGLTAKVRCGHTYLNPSNQEGAALALNAGGRTRLPFRFRWLGGRMVVISAAPDAPALSPGCEVLDWDGQPVSRLLAALVALAPADGHNDAKRRRLTELRGEDEWELFDLYLPLLYPELVAGGVARLRVRTPSGRVMRVEAPLWDRAQRLASIEKGVVTRGSAEPAWRLERLPGGAGWLTMRSWAVFDSAWDWKAALNASLDELAADRAPALVLDLRGNAGGLDVGDEILARLVDHDVRKTDLRRFTRYRRTPADLDPYLKTWDQSFRDWGDKAVGPDAAGFYRLTRYDDDAGGDLIRPQSRAFKGKLIVLVDASNSSATFDFAEAVKTNGLGALVGETTGGNRRGINGGAFFFLRLPGCGLEIDIPLIGAYPTTAQPDAGVEPDVPVVTTIADVTAGRDPIREAALRLARA